MVLVGALICDCDLTPAPLRRMDIGGNWLLQSLARTWERAAFIRARPVAGDMQIAKKFLSQIQPFV